MKIRFAPIIFLLLLAPFNCLYSQIYTYETLRNCMKDSVTFVNHVTRKGYVFVNSHYDSKRNIIKYKYIPNEDDTLKSSVNTIMEIDNDTRKVSKVSVDYNNITKSDFKTLKKDISSNCKRYYCRGTIRELYESQNKKYTVDILTLGGKYWPDGLYTIEIKNYTPCNEKGYYNREYVNYNNLVPYSQLFTYETLRNCMEDSATFVNHITSKGFVYMGSNLNKRQNIVCYTYIPNGEVLNKPSVSTSIEIDKDTKDVIRINFCYDEYRSRAKTSFKIFKSSFKILKKDIKDNCRRYYCEYDYPKTYESRDKKYTIEIREFYQDFSPHWLTVEIKKYSPCKSQRYYPFKSWKIYRRSI
jgi:hypothetical protein